jgi:alpha-tubulin suppressor-like RCC1 family protein
MLLGDAAAVSAGNVHTCAVTGGGVKCWGYNADGQLGDGTATDSLTPVHACADATCAAPLIGVAAVAAGNEHTCVLTTAGGVKCWGSNGLGELGDGTGTNSLTPVDVSGLTNGVAAISAGAFHTCALITAGGVRCWGFNSHDQLGDGTSTTRLAPVDVLGLTSGVAAVSAGDFHTCALTTVGGVKCWGVNADGQLGDGQACPSDCTPVDVSGLTTAAAVAGGLFHTCAVTTSGGVKCWGANDRGQLGDGTGGTLGDHSATPVDVCTDAVCMAYLGDGTSVSGGGFHTCALTMAGGVKCWGGNEEGQLGDAQVCGTPCTTPVDVVGLGPKPAPTPTAGATSSADTPSPSPSRTPTPPPCSLWGDVNGDGIVNAIDATYVLQYAAGLLKSMPCPDHADVNGDGAINAIDATVILQCSAGFFSCASLPR